MPSAGLGTGAEMENILGGGEVCVGFGNNGGANRICLVYCHYREL